MHQHLYQPWCRFVGQHETRSCALIDISAVAAQDRFCHLRDGGQFTNHSDDPNCGGDWTDSIETECAFTIKDIKAVRHSGLAIHA